MCTDAFRLTSAYNSLLLAERFVGNKSYFMRPPPKKNTAFAKLKISLSCLQDPAINP
jgi:hypothetical protein